MSMPVHAQISGGGALRPHLHVGDAYGSCFFDLHSELTQAEFDEFTAELGSILRPRQLGDAGPLGKGHFDIGLDFARTGIDDAKGAWNNTMSHPAKDHYLGDSYVGFSSSASLGVERSTDVHLDKSVAARSPVYRGDLVSSAGNCVVGRSRTRQTQQPLVPNEQEVLGVRFAPGAGRGAPAVGGEGAQACFKETCSTLIAGHLCSDRPRRRLRSAPGYSKSEQTLETVMAARIVMSTVGSLGDLHPYLAIARALRSRGHTITIATLAAYRDRVLGEGLDFHPVRPDLDPNDKEELRRVMDKRHGPTYLLRDIAFRFLRESFADCREAAAGGDLIVTHPVTYGMLLAARASGRPWASVALAPVSLFSALDASVYPGLPFADSFAGFGPRIQRAFMRLLDLGTRGFQKSYRDLERELGLPQGPNPVIEGQHSPYRVLALFSKELAAPQSDWPPQTLATGFPFFEQKETLPRELLQFLEAGERPIVFTLGSAAVGAAGDFFSQSAEAATRLGRRAVMLVGRDPENAPSALPAGILAVPYAPHAAVFARALTVVHQGGIGTTAEVMRAGCPSLVVPYSHDQPDHARRLRRLGIAQSLARESYHAKSAAGAIQKLLDDPGCATRAAEVGRRVRAEDGVGRAANAIEQLLHRASERPAARPSPQQLPP